ncbi:MAG: sulfur carrier protein ThiS adenylyltransferase ThiF [Ruminococcus sp.]|nr:sulfur carrier protein ThiS adenylyltransferase ThiF [Ruminococcus sp.]MCD7800464.1 sulfur carrier protein ThiS adenylyltransferase ThiF [Ruminococcus sp.]
MKIAIMGLGGLGSNISILLAKNRVPSLTIVDFDIVEPSNLNRQHYYVDSLGMFKTDALKLQLLEINPSMDVITIRDRVTEDNVISYFGDYDIICEAFDNPMSKAMLINSLLENRPNVKIVSGSGMAGYESANLIKVHHRFKNLYICGDLHSEAKVGNGLMSPRVSICAGLQAQTILNIIN